MTRQEFLGELRNALSGSISQIKINENINYYNNYIIEESRKGRTEEEVIEALGDPRLIAKTILSASDAEWENISEYENTYEERKAELPKGRIALVLVIAGILLVLLLPVLIPVLLVLVILILIWSRRR